jgi:hypothetical protein
MEARAARTNVYCILKVGRRINERLEEILIDECSQTNGTAKVATVLTK